MEDPHQAYLVRLGVFIHQFAHVESNLLYGLQKTAMVSAETARALFAGVRMDAAKNQIKRLREAHGTPESALLTRAFAQLADITRLRNDLVHYGATFFSEWEPHVSDQAIAMPGRERNTVVTPDLLEAATTDLITIDAAIVYELITSPKDDDFARATLRRANEPWLYKSLPPTHPGYRRFGDPKPPDTARSSADSP